jgi:hypothetical protein
VLDWVIDDIDLILIMSVNPGFGGQSFIDSALRKIEAVRKRIDASRGKDIRLEVDGGIKTDNIRRVADAGADTFVAGSAIFGKPDYWPSLRGLTTSQQACHRLRRLGCGIAHGHAGNRDVEQLGGVNHWHSDLDNVASWLECRQASTAGHAPERSWGWLQMRQSGMCRWR